MQPPEKDLPPVECAVCLGLLASGLCVHCTIAFGELELELKQPHMAQKPMLRGEVGCARVAREGLRSFGIQQVCPMCRVELSTGPVKLLEGRGGGSGVVRPWRSPVL